MKKIVSLLLSLSIYLICSAETYVIVEETDNSLAAQGTIDYYRTDSCAELNLQIGDLIRKKFLLTQQQFIDDKTIIYATDNGSVIIRQDDVASNVFYFEVPNFYAGMSGTIVYKTLTSKMFNQMQNARSNAQRVGELFGKYEYSLAKRSVIQLPTPGNDFYQEGVVVVRIEVNQYGRVVSATIAEGTTIIDMATRQLAINAAKRALFTESDTAIQYGTITYNFRLN